MHEPTWIRLDQTIQAQKKSGKDVDFAQFSRDVEAVQTHLNYVRTHFRDDELIHRLSNLCAQAGRAHNRAQPVSLNGIKRWFVEIFPAAFWTFRYWVLVSVVVFVVTFLTVGLWAINNPEVLDTLMPHEYRKEYVDHLFVDYYSDDEGFLFFSKVTTNNIGVALLSFGAGMLLTFPTLLVLVNNAINLGGAWAAFVDAGDQSTFWLHIAPHGFLELSAIFIAGGLGMALGWTWIKPGDRSRTEAFADVGSRSVTVILGTALILVLAGLIEGFVTGSTLPLVFKAAFGFVAWAGVFGVITYLGWQASRKGQTGSLQEGQRIEFAAPATLTYTRYA